jgi:hypothetical protein
MGTEAVESSDERRARLRALRAAQELSAADAPELSPAPPPTNGHGHGHEQHPGPQPAPDADQDDAEKYVSLRLSVPVFPRLLSLRIANRLRSYDCLSPFGSLGFRKLLADEIQNSPQPCLKFNYRRLVRSSSRWMLSPMPQVQGIYLPYDFLRFYADLLNQQVGRLSIGFLCF